MKRKLLTAVFCLGLATTMAFGLAACNKEKDKKKDPLSTPQNARVEGEAFVWETVTGASTYTVKINDSELPATSATTLDLTAATTVSYFVEGNNSLRVRADATDKNEASAYTQAVTYVYTPAPAGPTAFTKPVVTLSGDTLSWTAADGATNGYTVKIGELTFTVNTATLDLTTEAAKEYLVRGNNVISVKVNGTDDKIESAYSDSVTYEYVIAAAEEAEAFKAAVAAIDETVVLTSKSKIATAKAKYASLSDEAKEIDGMSAAIATLKAKDCAYFELLAGLVQEVTENSDKAAIDAAKEAIPTALAYYAELIDNTAVAQTKTALDGKKTAYDTLVASIQTQINDYKTALEAAESEKTKEESVSSLQTKTEAATAKKNAVCAAAQSFYAADYAAYNVRLGALTAAVAEWNAAIAAATTKLTVDSWNEADTDAAAEENIVTASTALDGYGEYPAYVKAEVTALYTEASDKLTAAQNRLKATVTELKTSVEAALGATTPSEANYAALTAEEEKLSVLGAYAQSQFDTIFEKSFTAVQQSLADAKTTMMNTPAETNVSENMTGGDNRRLYLTVQFKNFRGDLITEMTDLPQVTVTQQKTGVGNASVAQQLTKSQTGEYVAIIELYAVADIQSASYSIGDIEGAQNREIDVEPPLMYNPYFTDTNGADGFKVAFNETGILFTIQEGFTTAHPDGKTYLEIYEEGAVVKTITTNANGDAVTYLEVVGSAIKGKDAQNNEITRIDVSDWSENDKKFESFNRYLALNYGEYFIGNTRSVHFVIYGEAVVDGKTSHTAIGADTVSSVKEFKLTELDLYYTLPITGYSDAVSQDGDDYRFYLAVIAVAGGMIGDLNDTLAANGKDYRFTDAESLKTQFGIRVTIKSGNEVVGIANLSMAENAHKFSDIRFNWARAYFAEHPAEESKEFTNLTYTASYYALDGANADVKDLFRQGTAWALNTPDALGTVTLTTADRLIALRTTGKNGNVSDNNVWFSTVAVMGMMIDGSGESNGFSLNQILTQNGKEYQIANFDHLKDDFGIRLTINGTVNGEAWKCVLDLELGKTYTFADIVRLCSATYYKANPTVEADVAVSNLTFKACYCVRSDANAAVKDLFRESEEWDVSGLSASMTINRACITLNAPPAIDLDGAWLIIIRDRQNQFGGNGKLLESGAAKYVKFEFYDKAASDTKYTMYLFLNAENKAEFYKEINEDGTPKGESFIMAQNVVSYDVGAELGNFKTYLNDAFGITFIGNWVFTDQYVVTGSEQYLYSTPNTTEFVVTENGISKAAPESNGD